MNSPQPRIPLTYAKPRTAPDGAVTGPVLVLRVGTTDVLPGFWRVDVYDNLTGEVFATLLAESQDRAEFAGRAVAGQLERQFDRAVKLDRARNRPAPWRCEYFDDDLNSNGVPFYLDASDLGLKPGQWPEQIDLDCRFIGGTARVMLTRVGAFHNNAGRCEGYTYSSADERIRLVVMND